MKKYVYSAMSLLCVASVNPLFAQTSKVASGKIFNPDTSINFLSLYQDRNRGDRSEDGFSLQEAEIQFMSDIDPYWRASALFSVGKENGEWGIDPEEIFAETTTIPDVTMKIGKFKAVMGKHNQIHTHAFPFIDAPMINTTVLGDEGLNEAGVSAAGLLSFVPWYMEATLQAISGSSDLTFNGGSNNHIAGVGHLKNLFDVNDALTLEVGASAACGKNHLNANSSIFGGDLTFKYRPTNGGKYTSFQWATEYLNANRGHFENKTAATSFEDLDRVDGMATWLIYQFAERWSGGARYDVVGLVQKGNFAREQKYSALVGFNFSEFSGLRAQYDYSDKGSEVGEHHVALQLNIAMGAHPAHAY